MAKLVKSASPSKNRLHPSREHSSVTVHTKGRSSEKKENGGDSGRGGRSSAFSSRLSSRPLSSEGYSAEEKERVNELHSDVS